MLNAVDTESLNWLANYYIYLQHFIDANDAKFNDCEIKVNSVIRYLSDKNIVFQYKSRRGNRNGYQNLITDIDNEIENLLATSTDHDLRAFLKENFLENHNNDDTKKDSKTVPKNSPRRSRRLRSKERINYSEK